MGYSYNKSMALKPQKERWLSTFFIALACAAVIFAPFIIQDRGYFTFYGDFNVQQIPFYKMCHDAVRAGNFGWNWLTDLGSDFICSYSFYLVGSPFFWLTVPFPSSVVPYLMAPLLILKFACAALTAYFYIRRFTKTPEAARLGGLLYAFSGFSIYNIFFNHFHEAIIVFPLLLLSLELIITENKHGLFAVCVFLAAGVNFFFFYGMVIFTVIYLIIRMCSHAVTMSFGRFLSIVFESVLGLAATSVILLPTVVSLMGNARLTSILNGWSAIMYGKEQIYLNVIECFFFPPDLPARPVFFPGAEVKWSSLGGWLPLFSMVGVFAYCGKNKGNWLKRIICTSFVFAMFPILNSAFSAFNTAYYARWFFMPILMMCLATVMAAEDRECSFKSAFGWVSFITLAFTLVIGFFPQKTENGWVFGLYNSAGKSDMYKIRFWTTCIVSLISLAALLLLLTASKKRRKGFFNAAVSLVCVISVVYGMIFISGGREHAYSTDVTISSLIESKVYLTGDKDTYRIDTYECPDNTGMSLGYNSINAFHSVVTDSITQFYKFVGEERSVASRPSTDNYALRNLLSVKYLLNLEGEKSFENTDGTTKMPGYKYIETQDKFKVYENENYIPYGFCYDKYITETECEKYNAKNRAALMLKAVVLNDEQEQKYSEILTPLDTEDGFAFDAEEAAADSKVLRDNCAYGFNITETGFAAQIITDKPTFVFFSVPYKQGWTARVNGVDTDVERANIGFMAVKVEAGESTITFAYKNPYSALGIKISIGAAAAFAVYAIICIILRKKRREVEYPEGDMLISRWTEYDVADTFEEENGVDEGNDGEYKSSLDAIAEELGKRYPVRENKEFTGGFTINAEIDNEKHDGDDTLDK